MKIPLSWLREFVAFEVEPQRLADDLTAAGLAVDAIEKTRRRDACSTSTSRPTASTA